MTTYQQQPPNYYPQVPQYYSSTTPQKNNPNIQFPQELNLLTRKEEDHRIFIFERSEYFTEEDFGWVNNLNKAGNAAYRACYKFWFIFMIVVSFLAIPFIGMAAGMFDSIIAIYARPFVRPIGKLFADMFGYNVGSQYFKYNQLQQQPQDKHCCEEIPKTV